MNKIKVVMDPAALAFVPEMTARDVLERIPFLAEWAKLIRTSVVDVHLAPDVREFLLRNNFFPAHETVAAAIEALGLRHRYAPQDVISPVTTIVTRALADLYCCVKDEAHEDFSSTPPQPWNSNNQLNYQSQRTLLLSLIERLLHESPVRIAFANAPITAEISFSGAIALVDPDGLPGLSVSDLPRTVDGNACAVRSFEDVLDCCSALEHWATATDNGGIKFAIQARCREKLKETGLYRSFDKLPNFFVGAGFYSSLIGCQASGTSRYASVTLEACACATLGLETVEWHPFEKPPRTADGAFPLRAHLTKSGVALRLMAWRRPGANSQCLEFANVGAKWEEEIASDNPAEAV